MPDPDIDREYPATGVEPSPPEHDEGDDNPSAPQAEGQGQRLDVDPDDLPDRDKAFGEGEDASADPHTGDPDRPEEPEPRP